jgi:hypothetical protein
LLKRKRKVKKNSKQKGSDGQEVEEREAERRKKHLSKRRKRTHGRCQVKELRIMILRKDSRRRVNEKRKRSQKMSRLVRRLQSRSLRDMLNNINNYHKNPLKKKKITTNRCRIHNSKYTSPLNSFKTFETNNVYKKATLPSNDTPKWRKKITSNNKVDFRKRRRLKLKHRNLMKKLNISHMMSN